jgi:acyl-CoA synthetase (AMP-forming)/AMP-acid ligase II
VARVGSRQLFGPCHEMPPQVMRTVPPHLVDHAGEFRVRGYWPSEVADPVAAIATTTPGRPALVDRRERLDYGQLDRRVNNYASLLADHGLEAGDTVVAVASNDCRSVVAYHAMRRLGLKTVLLTDHAAPAEVSQAIERTEPRLALASRRLIDLQSSRYPLVRWLSSEDESSTGVAADLGGEGSDPNSPGVVLFTSGSTSHPKGVVHSTNTLRVAAENYLDAAGLEPTDVFFLVSPLSSITGVLQALVMAPLLGACVVLEDTWDDVGTFDLLVREHATFYGGPDVVLRRLLDEAERRNLSSLPVRAVSVGGTMLDAVLLRRAEKDYGICVMRAYGSSEAPFSTTTPPTADLEERLGTDGRPTRGVEIRIGSQRHEGECLIRGPHLFLGYIDADDNDEAFEEGWFRTGDTGTFRDDQLKIAGRLKEIVIRNGIKISMSAVEQAARGLAFVEDAAAYSQPDPDTGEHLVLAVRTVSGAIDFEMMITALLETGLSRRSLPEELVIWDEPFPRTPTDKLSRVALARESSYRPRMFVERLSQ